MSLDALLTSAAFAPLDNAGWLRVSGTDRVRWLNGMTTNNIAALTPGQGCYTFFLNAQGRILADATAFLLEDSILLETASPGSLATMLDRFIIMDDVDLEVLESSSLDRKWFVENQPKFPPPNNLDGILIAGPDSPRLVQALGTRIEAAAACTSPPSAPPSSSLGQPPHLKQTLYAGSPVHLIRAHSPLVPRFEIWSDPSILASILEELSAAPVTQASEADLEALRILEGTALYGTDIRNTETAKDLPQETNQTRALHFSKGCYLGQEIVERIHSRGAVHRTFTGFLLSPEVSAGIPDLDGMILNAGISALPAPATPLFANDATGKPIGELTSVAATSFGYFALGYLRREALDARTSIQYRGGTAIPSPLPFPIDMKRA